MARDTLRDRVWHQIIEFCDNDADFQKDDIVQTTDASDRTVHDVIQTAVSYGIVERREEARSVEFGDRGREQLQQVAIYSSVDTARETPEDRQTDDSTPTPEADKPDSDADEVTQTEIIDESATDDTDNIGSLDARYVIECPDCEYTITRKQNSKLVKSVRRLRRHCAECEATVRLTKDDRPNPPECPECDREVLYSNENDQYTSYVHDAHVTTISGMKMIDIDESCLVS